MSQQEIDAHLDDVAKSVETFAREQVDLWRQVPAVALESAAVRAVGWGPGTQLEDYPYTRGYEVVSTSSRGYVDLFVDLASGELVQGDLRTPPRRDQLIWLALNPRRLDANNVMAEYRKDADHARRTKPNAALVYGMDESSPQSEIWHRVLAALTPAVGPPFDRSSGATQAIASLFEWACQSDPYSDEATANIAEHVWLILPDSRVEGGWMVLLHRDAPVADLERSLAGVQMGRPVRLVPNEIRERELRFGLTTTGQHVDKMRPPEPGGPSL